MDELLFDIFGEEQLKVLVKCLKTLSSFNVVETWPQIEAVLLNDNAYDHFDKKQEIVSVVRTTLTEILKVHWVWVEEDTPLDLLNDITYCLFDSVTNYEPSMLLSGVSLEVTQENSPEDALASLIAFLYSRDYINVVEYISKVDSALVRNIVTALETKVIPDYESTNLELRQRYLDFIGITRKGVVYDYLVQGGVIGNLSALSLTTLMEESIEVLPIDDMVFETASLVLISSDETNLGTIYLVTQFLTDDVLLLDSLRTKVRQALGVSNEA
jgi:hypothetical protein